MTIRINETEAETLRRALANHIDSLYDAAHDNENDENVFLAFQDAYDLYRDVDNQIGGLDQYSYYGTQTFEKFYFL